MSGLPPHSKKYAESEMNLALLDPPRWGWPAIGGVTDLLPPHERARRKESKRAFVKAKKRKRERPRPGNASTANTAPLKPPPATATAAPQKPPVDPKTNESAPASAASNLKPPTPQSEGQQPATSQPTPEKLGEASNDESQCKNNQQSNDESSIQPDSQGTEAPKQTEKLNEDNKEPSSQNPKTVPAPKPTTNDKPATTKDSAMTTAETESSVTQTKEIAPQTVPVPTAAEPHPKLEEKGKDDNTNDNAVKIGALRGDGNLDIYAYHRGREGMEPRDATTGELLCDVVQTDTNYKWDEPKMSLQVAISFPLGDESDTKGPVPMFEDTIVWNLGNPETPTPMAFATATAEDFGLSFGQTVDLAASIQDQIFHHIREHCGYAVPVAMTDGAGMDRMNFPPQEVSRLYGFLFETGAPPPGTFWCAATTSKRSRNANRGQSFGTQSSSSRRNAANNEDRGNNRPPPIPLYDEPVEDVYVEEVQRRMVEYSKVDVATKSEERGVEPPGRLTLQHNFVCHICHKRHNLVGKFQCGFQSHSYCASHLRNRLDVTVQSLSDVAAFDHCPICAVACRCSKCGRRRDALAIQLKRLGEEQGVDARSTVFDDMFTCFTKPQAAIRFSQQAISTARRRESSESKASENKKGSAGAGQLKSAPKSKSSRRSSAGHGQGVASAARIKGKVPATEFPREFRSGIDQDPGTSIDYRTVYSEEGQIVKDLDSVAKQKPSKLKSSEDSAFVAEDGNVDYCNTCRKHGDLVCCDHCPRAWHEACLTGEGNDEAGGRWECPLCKRAKEDLPEYTLTGSESQSKICAAYSDLQAASDDDLTQLTLLSKIHEMLEKLMLSDFGALFSVPVDPKQVPEYPKLIKKPMDLGTIASKLLNGGYKKFFHTQKSWADVHLAILKDVELVWHNCFTFNYEGSSIYRMAEVLRRSMLAMRSKSLDKDLPDSVLHKLDDYVRACRQQRGKIPVSPKYDGRPMSRHKITVASHKGGNTTQVAILDPDTGMVVKIYTTLRSAGHAARFVNGRGYEGEITLGEQTFKALVRRSAHDPTALLFGYRWLEHDKLRGGQVSFLANAQPGAKPAIPIFEWLEGQSVYRFFSVDDAVSHPRLPRDVPLQELKKALLQLSDGKEGVKLFGLTWRRLRVANNGKALHKDVVLSPYWANGGAKESIDSGDQLPNKATIAKEDRILGRTVGGFETLDAAFEDWVLACKSSPSVPEEEITRPNFHTYYLDGDRNVDGVIWKTIEPTLPSDDEEPQEAKPTPTDAVAMDVDADMSHSPTHVTNEEEKEEVTAQEGAPNAPLAVVGAAPEAASSDTIIQQATTENLLATAEAKIVDSNGEGATTALAVAAVNGDKKRERSEDEDLMPRKK